MVSRSRRRSALAYLAGIALVIWICFVWAVPRQTDPPVPKVLSPPAGHAPTDADRSVLRVCADPDNLPFANARGEGFENAIAELLAGELGRSVEYHWAPQRRGYVRTTIQARVCDVLMSVPSMLERVRTTRPYYRSTYVFVTRRDRGLSLRSLDDPRLRNLRIGIRLAHDEYDNPPTAQALVSRQLSDRLRGSTVYGADSKPRPQRAILDAVTGGDLDVAIVWGPLAGYFAARERIPVTITPVLARQGRDVVPFALDMSIAVRQEDWPLHADLDAAIARRASDIQDILRRYGVPLVTGT
jgi:mxaJ protein